MPLVAHLAALSQIAPVIAGFFSYYSCTKEMRILFLYLIISILVDIVSLLLALADINNMVLFHVYTLLEYSFLIIVFSCWQKNNALAKALRISIPVFVLISMGAKIFLEDPLRYDNFSSSFESSILATVSAYTLLKLVGENLESLFTMPRFWVSLAVLIYFTGNLFTFALGSVIFTWTVQHTLGIIANLCYAGGFLSQRRR